MGRHPIQIALLAGAAIAVMARAQTQPEGPVVVGERREDWKMFDLRRLDGSFEFLGQYQLDRLEDRNGNTQVERETLFRELLNLNGEASIGHKNLIDLTGVVQLGLENRSLDSDLLGGTTHDMNSVNLYDVRALILANGPAPTTVYSRREQNLMDFGFGSRVDQTINETGIITSIRSEVAPTTFQYFHRTMDQSDPFGQADSSTTQDTFSLQSGIRLTSNQALAISYTFNHMQEDQPGIYSDTLDTQDANIIHTLGFGDTGQNELRSTLRIYDETGLFPRHEYRLDEALVLRHSDRLETRYNLTADQQGYGGEDQHLYRGEASIRHRLFESLTSTATVGGQRLEAPDGSSSEDVFVSGQMDYTKSVPMGRIDASGGANFDAQHNSERGSTVSVFNEPHVYNAPFPIVLNRRNIVVGSIVATPPSGFPRYREGIDYTVDYFPDRTELTIPLGSAIGDGQTVLVTYDVGPEPESDLDTLGTVLSFRYTLTEGTLQGLSVYTTYRTTNQWVDTPDPSLFVLDDVRDLLLGVEYTRGGLDVLFEHQNRDSTIDPYDSDRLQASYLQPLGRESSASLVFEHNSISYKLTDNRVDFDRFIGRWIQRINSSLNLNARLEYRSERDSLDGDSQGFAQDIGLTWHRAQTTVYGSVRNAFLDGPGSEQTSQLFQLGIRRAF